MQFELATPTRLLVSAEVDEVVLPGTEGYFGVWENHAPLLATLGAGELMYRQGRDEHHVAVIGGFAEVTPGRVIVLAEHAELPEEIDVPRAERAKQRAEQRLAGRIPEGATDEGGTDFDRALAALARALTRLTVAQRAPRLAGARAH